MCAIWIRHFLRVEHFLPSRLLRHIPHPYNNCKLFSIPPIPNSPTYPRASPDPNSIGKHCRRYPLALVTSHSSTPPVTVTSARHPSPRTAAGAGTVSPGENATNVSVSLLRGRVSNVMSRAKTTCRLFVRVCVCHGKGWYVVMGISAGCGLGHDF